MTSHADQDLERWRALVERGLKGAPFDSLVGTTLEGIAIEPLYTERDRPSEEGVPWAPSSPLVGPVLHRADAATLDAQRREGATFVWLDAPLEDIPELPAIDGLEVLAVGTQGASLARSHVRSVSGVDVLRAAEIEAAIRAGRAALGVNVSFYRELGVDAVDELGLALASWVRALRALEARGLDVDACVRATTFAVGLGTDFFGEIAKLRALRRLVDRIASVCGARSRPFIAARTSARELAELDASNNLLRGTLAIAAGLIGGADAVACDEAAARTGRLARNLPLVLALESHLGAVADPARGSYFVESLTDSLTRAGWESFRAIEREGGDTPAVRASRIERASAARRAAVATRRKPIVGVSRFPTKEPAPPLEHGSLHDSAAFEALRARARRHAARVITLDACPPARVDFAREILAISGLPDDVVAFTDDALGDASIVILAAPDAALPVEVPAAVRALRAAGAKAIGVAAKPGAHEQALRDAGVDAFVFLGADVVAFAETLLAKASS
ncbi:methylmalonyl-CoA mutase family protein [Sandaracinus amylolyticus]|uniref:Methylmalonyl-CoA mutase n=1 Tax=Sandaracinus amylolyticus TaxID=927083 RepID=A0A0F6W459_9BACT|nr:methylmalonyl-CoA mutase family protein [Sandaracinus amylolyticus]AKF06827.1 Methylmalonyl-CoA mutase [Sandaracinus amylolyticus]